MNDVRRLRVHPEGLQAFRKWAHALSEAEERGEDVPAIQDLDAVVEWLDERDLIVAPVPSAEHARLLIELCLSGGEKEVRRRRRG